MRFYRGRNKYCKTCWHFGGTRFSLIFCIICISEGYQDLTPGVYQVFSLIRLGIYKIFTGTPTRNLIGKCRNIISKPKHPFNSIQHLRHLCRDTVPQKIGSNTHRYRRQTTYLPVCCRHESAPCSRKGTRMSGNWFLQASRRSLNPPGSPESCSGKNWQNMLSTIFL